MVTVEEVRELLEERPDLEQAIGVVLEAQPPWSFHDVDLDSGELGELVSRGIVERTADGYRVTDPDAARRALDGEAPNVSTQEITSFSVRAFPVTRLEIALLAGAIALVVALRLVSLPSVYRPGGVVLSSNDPYFYRYLVEQLLSNPDVRPSSLPFEINRSEPLFVVSLWLATTLLGGTKAAAGHVMAWYPVASAAVTALLLYALAVVVTDDRRIGLASVAMLAVIPGHALRTSFGFADHHAFDYPWLVLTFLGLALVARAVHQQRPTRSLGTMSAVSAIAIGVTGQTLAWDNSPLLMVAIVVFLLLEALRALRTGAAPKRSIGPVVIGLVGAAVLTWIAHAVLGWHTPLVAVIPAMLTLGAFGLLIGGELFTRLDLPARGFVLLEAIGLAIGALVARAAWPAFWRRLTTNLEQNLLAPRPIAEVEGLFADSGGWLLLLGFALFVGVPYLVWASARAAEDGRWLPPVAYGWYFLVLATIQVRFVGQLAPVLSLFAGLGLVHLAERVDVARRPAPFTDSDPPDLRLPTRRQFGHLALVFLLVASLGIVQVPVKTSQVTVPPAQSDAALWMADYSEAHGMTYPSNYVLSEWGWSRLYNYFVSGESRSYGYAQANFERFVGSTDPAGWYERLGSRRGFVVTTPDVVGGPRQLGTRLHRDNGAGSGNAPALAHYRLVHVTGDGAYKVFTVVPGALIRGTAAPNATVAARTEVAVRDVWFTYQRTATANPEGRYAVRVAQPGTYAVEGTSVVVNESAVRNGSTVTVG